MSKAPTIRPDFDTDCLWKPMPRRPKQQRTMSTDSTDSEVGRKMSFNETVASASSPVEIRPRRLSISEMIFGSPSGGFSWGQSSAQSNATHNAGGNEDRKSSVTEDLRFKELMKHQNKILGDGQSGN